MLESLLDRALAARGRIEVLRELHRLPSAYSASARNIATIAGIDHRVAQRSLDDLVDIGVVSVRRTPAANYYELNRDHVLADGLARLFEAERRLEDELRRELARAFEEGGLAVHAVYVYGSVARGEGRPRDIDVALVTDEAAEPALRGALEGIHAALAHRFGLGFHFVIATKPLVEMVCAEPDQTGLWHSVAAEGRKL
jgi:DNA-binding transcriptional ArsR family regulator